MGETGGEE